MDYYRRMHALVDESLSLLEESAGEDNSRLCSISSLVVGCLRDLHEHLGGRMLNVHLLQQCRAVVGDGDITKRIDEHLVHASRAERALDYFGNQFGRLNVVPLGLPPPRPTAPFFEDNYGLAAGSNS